MISTGKKTDANVDKILDSNLYLRHSVKMTASLTAIGRGSTIVGLILILAAKSGTSAWMLRTGEILIAVGIVLLMVHFWRQWRRL